MHCVSMSFICSTIFLVWTRRYGRTLKIRSRRVVQLRPIHLVLNSPTQIRSSHFFPIEVLSNAALDISKSMRPSDLKTIAALRKHWPKMMNRVSDILVSIYARVD